MCKITIHIRIFSCIFGTSAPVTHTPRYAWLHRMCSIRCHINSTQLSELHQPIVYMNQTLAHKFWGKNFYYRKSLFRNETMKFREVSHYFGTLIHQTQGIFAIEVVVFLEMLSVDNGRNKIRHFSWKFRCKIEFSFLKFHTQISKQARTNCDY